MDFLNKLDYLMASRGLTRRALSSESAIPYTTIVGFYTKGYGNTKMSTIRKLASYFDVSIDYLLLDEVTDPNYGKSGRAPESHHLSEAEFQLIQNYRGLTSEGKAYIQQQMAIACTMFAGKNNAPSYLEEAE